MSKEFTEALFDVGEKVLDLLEDGQQVRLIFGGKDVPGSITAYSQKVDPEKPVNPAVILEPLVKSMTEKGWDFVGVSSPLVLTRRGGVSAEELHRKASDNPISPEADELLKGMAIMTAAAHRNGGEAAAVIKFKIVPVMGGGRIEVEDKMVLTDVDGSLMRDAMPYLRKMVGR